jgi:hypothetical protein
MLGHANISKTLDTCCVSLKMCRSADATAQGAG